MRQPGDQVAVGLLGGTDELALFRERRHAGILNRLWRRFEANLPCDTTGKIEISAAGLAFAACVLQRADLATVAIRQALDIARRPWASWIHPEAGCMTLGGAEQAIDLCLAVDWVWPLLNRDQREALLCGLTAKAIENLSPAPDGFRDEDGAGMLLLVRRLDRDDPCCLHQRPEQLNNWDAWFATALLMTAALVKRAFLNPADGEPALQWGHYYRVGYTLDAARVARWQAIAIERLRGVIANQIGENGDYGEGFGYLTYGIRPLLYAVRVAQRAANIDLMTDGMARLPFWARNQYPAGLAFGIANFNDAVTFSKPPLALYAHFAGYLRDPRIQGYLEEAMTVNRDIPGPLELLGVDPSLTTEPVILPEDTVYPRTGTVIWRTSRQGDGIYFALQCGAHGGAHQHQDRGHFYLTAYGERLLVDTGDNRRLETPSDIPHVATRAHNMILIDGRGQIGDNTAPVHGGISDVRSDAIRSTVLADASACYEHISVCRRRVVFMRPDLFVVADRVDGDCRQITWPAQGYDVDGQCAWTFAGQVAVFKRPLAHLHLYLIEPVLEWRVSGGAMDNRPKQIQRVEAVISGAQSTVILVPVRPGENAPVFSATADGGLRVNLRDRVVLIRREHHAVTMDETIYEI